MYSKCFQDSAKFKDDFICIVLFFGLDRIHATDDKDYTKLISVITISNIKSIYLSNVANLFKKSKNKELTILLCLQQWSKVQILIYKYDLSIAESHSIREHMQEFQKEIKNCRLFCKLNEHSLSIALLNFEEDQLFESQLDNNTLPPSVTQLVTNIMDLYNFLRDKVKYFKIIGPGKLICYKYTGTAQKYIILELQRKQLKANEQSMRYIGFLKQQLKKMQGLQKENAKMIKGQRSKIYLLQGELQKFKQPVRRVLKRNKTNSVPDSREIQQTKSIQQVQFKKLIIKECKSTLVHLQKSKLKQLNSLSEKEIMVEGNKTIHSQKDKQVNKIVNEDIGEKYRFEINKSCRFYDKFMIKGNEVQKVISTDSYQLCSKQQLKKSKSFFTFLLKKLKYGNLIAGVITEDLLVNKESSYSVGCVCFDNYYGVIMNNGVQEPNHYPKLKDGDILTLVIDFQQKKVELRNGEQQFAQTNLPQNMLISKLYPYFQLFDRDDCIILNEQT